MLRLLIASLLASFTASGQESQPTSTAGALRVQDADLGVRRAVAVPRRVEVARDWSETPALVVIVTVDQLATWVLDEALPHCGERGFRRLVREGVSFPLCAYRHACSETGPGHATIGTGADAATHGIVGNEWRDPATGQTEYCCFDANATAVGGDGAQRSARNLLVPTLGEQMKLYLGKESQVVSLSWKDRSAIFMAGRSADAVLWFSKKNGLLVTSTAYGNELPAWAAAFNRARPADAFFGLTWHRFASQPAYAGLVDDVPFERVDFNNARTLPAVIDGGKPKLEATFYEHLYESPFANELLLSAAEHALLECGLGKGGPPDLLCISFSSNDAIGHRNGPQSVEVRDMTLRTDALLARLLEVLDQRIGMGRYAVVLTADHGVQPIPELAQGRGIPAGRGPLAKWAGAAVEAALAKELGAPPEPLKSWVLSAADGMIYLRRDAIAATGKDLARVRALAARVAAKARGIASAWSLEDLLAQDASADPVLAALRRGTHEDRSPDVTLVPRPLWVEGTLPATHGTPWPTDRSVPLLVTGPGLRSGTPCRDQVSPGAGVVIAARMLGIPPPPGAEDPLPDVFSPSDPRK